MSTHKNKVPPSLTHIVIPFSPTTFQSLQTNMAAPKISEKKETIEPIPVDTTRTMLESSQDPEAPSKDRLHIVRRNEPLLAYDLSQESIKGFDANLMGARTTLSAEEEKKLLRRIDWHLIPLLAIMYCLKTMDMINVSFPTSNFDSVPPYNTNIHSHAAWRPERIKENMLNHL